MAPRSQAAVLLPSTPTPISHIRRRNDNDASISDVRLSKKPRLASYSQDKENTRRVPSQHRSSHSGKASLHRAATGEDELAMMEDLMAGIDASVLENYEASSPVKPLSASPNKVERSLRILSPKKISPKKLDWRESESSRKKETFQAFGIARVRPVVEIKIENDVKEHLTIKGDSDIAKPEWMVTLDDHKKPRRKAEVTKEIKVEKGVQVMHLKPLLDSFEAIYPTPDIFPDGGYEKVDDFADELFEFDLSDLSAFDDDLFREPEAPVKYPILHPVVPTAPEGYKSTPWARCTVDVVLDGLHFGDGHVPKLADIAAMAGPSVTSGKTAIVTTTSSGIRRVVHLKERWVDLPLRQGDIINMISPALDSPSFNQPVIISFKLPQTFIIHHPDLLLTMTSIANAMPCPRKPILQSIIKPSAPNSKSMLYGTILHTLLQGALMDQDFSIDGTRKRLEKDLKKEERRMEVWGAGLGIEDVRLEIGMKGGKGFETFGQKWVGATPHNGGELHTNPGDKAALLAITGLHEVEEDIWSPKWGLKGKVDASVQVKIIRDQDKADAVEEHVAPLEIKTGRSVGVMAHRAQTMLYTLLMEDRYGIPIPAGLLYYSQLDSILRVEARPNEIRSLIIARNELANHLSAKRSLEGVSTRPTDTKQEVDLEDTPFLPATIDHPRECRSCYTVDSCMLYRKAVDGVYPSEEDPIAELYEEKAGHLTEKDMTFFKKWEALLTVEEQDIGRFRSQLWTMTAKDREKTGRCFGDMVIDSYSNDIGKSLAKIHRHTYTFIRRPTPGQTTRHSLLSGHIAKGDPVSLSIEPDLLCLSRGFVTELTPSSITIGVTYVIDVEALLARTGRKELPGQPIAFRIDKDEMASGMMRIRANLAQLFFAGGDEARRRLVVDLLPPRFDISLSLPNEEMPSSLNSDQRKAMNKVMSAKDYALILGMPGTGKTTTIAEIIKSLVERGKSVLLTSYTHSAVDTILMKLLNVDFGVLRLGNIDKVHPDVQHLTLEALEGSSNMQQFEARLMGPPVVAATCLSTDHPIFFRRKFDYCIVDEASQITLPTCLGPLRMADTFILVGDHFQLPPIVRHAEARRGGLDISLFRMLSEAHPDSVVDLSMQYRMNEDIMCLSNELIYEGRLKCGNEEVRRQGLVLRGRKGCGGGSGSGCGEGECWVQALMDENVKAVFVDTDQVPALDSKIGDLVQNVTEAKLVYQLSQALVDSGLNQSDLAVITPYRQQIKLLNGLFRSLPRLEILTADKSQGRDKECILISLVRSNDLGNIGDLLRDWRRINVSFTRAKKKLVIFGSRKTLGTDRLLKGFLELMEGKGWIYTLKRGDDKLHHAPESISPMKGKKEKGKMEGKGRMGFDVLAGKPFVTDLLAELA